MEGSASYNMINDCDIFVRSNTVDSQSYACKVLEKVVLEMAMLMHLLLIYGLHMWVRRGFCRHLLVVWVQSIHGIMNNKHHEKQKDI